eukprot:UC1_evm1s1780
MSGYGGGGGGGGGSGGGGGGGDVEVAAALTSSKKPVLAVDLDEVLGHFVPTLADFHNEKYGTALTAHDFDSYTFREVWGGDESESKSKVNAFFASPHFTNGIPVVEGAQEAMIELSRHFELVIVTSRQHAIAAETSRWIDEHFSGLFSRVLFGNHWGATGEKRSKPDMCDSIEAVALIDDSLRYALQCAGRLQRVILFGHHAWNQHQGALPDSVVRVADWTGAVAELKALLPSSSSSSP